MNRNLSPKIAKGIYGNPRQRKGGDYLQANVSQTSGGILLQPSTVNGNANNVRKIVKSRNGKK